MVSEYTPLEQWLYDTGIAMPGAVEEVARRIEASDWLAAHDAEVRAAALADAARIADAAEKPDHHVDHHEDEREALIEDRKAVLAVLNQSPALPLDVVSAQIMMVLMDRGFRRPVSGEGNVPDQR